MSVSSVISIIFWIFFIIKVVIPIVKKAEGNLKDTTNSETFRKLRQAQNNFSPNNTYYTQKRSIVKVNNLKGVMENRESDWLAKQLREEQQAQRIVSDMFQLKQEHLSHCDSEILKAEHYNNCDARQNQETYKGKDKMSQADMEALKERIRQRTH